MNNLILQKLIYGYQSEEWLENMQFPKHFDIRAPKIPTEDLKTYFKAMSYEIQQAAKFYIDMRAHDNQLTEIEMAKIVEDMPIFLPYESCYIQFDTGDIVMNLLVHQQDGKSVDTDEAILNSTMIVYDKSWGSFSHDMAIYSFSWREHERHNDILNRRSVAWDFTYWVKGMFADYITIDEDEEHVYCNPSLDNWVGLISSVIVTLNVHLNYPEISKQREVHGRPNTTIAHGNLKKFTHSLLRSKPQYEHKTLVIDMYGNEGGWNDPTEGRSQETAFHTVRKHMRRLPTGKKTFVKAHFRGSREVGTVTKDYKILL